MLQKPVRNLIIGQISFFVFIGVCTAIIPKFLFESNEGGISNFGVHNSTIVPFSLAFLLSIIFTVMAAEKIKGHTKRLIQIRLVLYILASLTLLVLVSTYPYKINSTFKNLHILTGAIIFVFEMAVSFWLALVIYKNKLNSPILLIQLLGFLAAFFTLIGVLHLLFVSQIVTGLAFGALLIRSVNYSYNHIDNKHN